MAKNYKEILILGVAMMGLVLAEGVFAQCQYHNVYGWAWSENIGWISASCEGSGNQHWALVDDVVADGYDTYIWTDSTDWQADAYELEDFAEPGARITQVLVYVVSQGEAQVGIKVRGEELIDPTPLIWPYGSWRVFETGGFNFAANPLQVDEIREMQVIVRLRKYESQSISRNGAATQIYVRISGNYLPLPGTINETLRPNGIGDYTTIENPPEEFVPDYGVDIDESTGQFSGYAWSENIGWISFEPTSLAGCPGPSGSCGAWLDLDGTACGTVGQVCGWARACSVFQTGCSGVLRPNSERGGWDGWINLKGTATDGDGSPYGVTLNTTPSPSEFEGWAWGSDVVGWISFNHLDCDPNGDGDPNDGPAACVEAGRDYSTNPIPDYKVMTDIDINLPAYVEPGSCVISGSEYCTNSPDGFISLQWIYQDADGDRLEQYHLQIATDDYFINKVVDFESDPALTPSVSPGWPVTSGVTVEQNPTSSTQDLDIGYNGTYYWRVKVRAETGNTGWSEWEEGSSFNTPSHPYPSVSFSWDPDPPSEGEDVLFTDETTLYNGFDSRSWTFEDGEPATSTEINPTVVFNSAGLKNVTLNVRDSTGYSCTEVRTIDVGVALLPLPTWKEIAPF